MPTMEMLDDKMFPVTENLIGIARDEFKFYALEIKNRQTTIQNIYFWIASALFTVYAAAFKGLFTGQEFIHLAFLPNFPAVAHKAIVLIAFAVCGWVIFTGVSAMRGRNLGHRDILGSHTPLAMLEGYLKAQSLTQPDIIRHLLRECKRSTLHNAEECERIGKHLRNTSWALVTSMGFGAFAFVI